MNSAAGKGLCSLLITEILSVGTELLMGQIANTDAQYISMNLPLAGGGVYYHTVVGDNPDRLGACLRIALERADIVITTGGLGPTQDDLTKKTVASYFGLELIEDVGTRRKIDDYFNSRGLTPTENNYAQARFPEGALILKNANGTAPGCIIEGKGVFAGKTVIMLPGPPDELIPMFDSYVPDYYAKLTGACICSKFVKICGLGESLVETELLGLIDGQTNPTFATYVKAGIVTVRVTAGAVSREEADKIASKGASDVRDILGEYVYSVDGGEPEEVLIKLLSENGLTLSCAESITGGMIAAKLTSVPGASKVFCGGAVTYTDGMKNRMLSVKKETLASYTAVSEQTCTEMAAGVKKLTGTDYSIAVTGYAGPPVESEPVGLVYIGVATPQKTVVKEFHFKGPRERIRTLTAVNAIDLTRRLVLETRNNDGSIKQNE